MKELFKLTKLLFALAALLLVSKVIGVNTQSDESESSVHGLDFKNPINVVYAETSNNAGDGNQCGVGCGCGCDPDVGNHSDPDSCGCCETGCGCGCSSGSDGSCW